MNMVRNRIWVVFVAIVLSNSAASDPIAPKDIGTFAIAAEEKYEDARYGTRYRYQNRDGGVDVYIYPMLRELHLKSGEPVENETREFLGSLRQMEERGLFQEAKIISVIGFVANILGKKTTLRVKKDSEIHVSLLYLFEFDSNFLKVRATIPDSDTVEQLIDDFVRQLVSKLSPKAEQTRGKIVVEDGIDRGEALAIAKDFCVIARCNKYWDINSPRVSEGKNRGSWHVAFPSKVVKEGWTGGDIKRQPFNRHLPYMVDIDKSSAEVGYTYIEPRGKEIHAIYNRTNFKP